VLVPVGQLCALRVVPEGKIKLVSREIFVFVRDDTTQSFIFFSRSAFAINFALVFTTSPNPSQKRLT
jgi:hypothetical protein